MSDRDDDSEHDGGRSGAATAALPWAVTLNLDILQVILWYLPRADLLSVSCTSRVVRELAVMELLSRCQKVVYGHSSPFQKWCEFVLADSSRLMCIRDLFLSFEGLNIVEDGSEEGLDDSEDSEDSTDSEAQRDQNIHEQVKIDRKPAKLVLDVLRGATCLQRLSIGWADAILEAVPGVASAISCLPALKSFTVEPYSVHAQHSVTDVLATMQSRLTFIHLLHVTYKSCDDSQTGAWDYDLPRALAPHLGTLEELHLGSPDGRTPRVRSTTLHTLEIPLAEQQPRPRELFEAFPNLRTLRTNNYWSGFDPFDSVEEDRYLELRDSRISEQRGGHVWASLDTLRGSFMHLYVLGLTCPVRRLEIQSYLPSKHGAAMDIVRYASPQKLILGIKCCKSERATIHQPSLVVPESSDRPHVTHLTVRILLGTPISSTQDLINDLVPLLQNSKIEYLRLAMGGTYMSDDKLEEHWILDWEHRVKKCVRNLDVRLLRDALIGVSTTLRVLAFTIVIRGQTAWTIDRSSPGTATATEVDPVDARELIRREEA